MKKIYIVPEFNVQGYDIEDLISASSVSELEKRSIVTTVARADEVALEITDDFFAN